MSHRRWRDGRHRRVGIDEVGELIQDDHQPLLGRQGGQELEGGIPRGEGADGVRSGVGELADLASELGQSTGFGTQIGDEEDVAFALAEGP